jgi:hypothetical protein
MGMEVVVKHLKNQDWFFNDYFSHSLQEFCGYHDHISNNYLEKSVNL